MTLRLNPEVRITFKMEETGPEETLTAIPPDDLVAIAAIRVDCQAAYRAWTNTEASRRIRAAIESQPDEETTLDVPEEEYAIYERWLSVGLPETVECVTGYAVNGVDAGQPIEAIRAALKRDQNALPHLRRLRGALFLGMTDDTD